MLHPKISDILRSAVTAPSGCNCQPWRFEVKENTIRIFNIPDRDTSLYNHLQKASLAAHGALIENAMLASRASGFDPDLRLLPEKKYPDLIAEIELREGSPKVDPLFEFIPKRTSNRKKYNASTLSTKEKNNLLNQAFWFPHLRLEIADTDEQKEVISKAIGLNDCITFENSHLHRFLFEHIRWTKKDAEHARDGLGLKALAPDPVQQVLFPALKNWGAVNFMNMFGLSRIMAIHAANLCMSSSAVCMISAPDDSAINLIESGRLMQRLGLEASRLGLSTHIMTGITFLIQRVLSGEFDGLSKNHIDTLLEHNDLLKAAFGLSEEILMICFRIGRAAQPAALSLRIPANDITTTL
ncbi:MAG: hypothetical protein LLF86_00925 [Nitrospiraceae bacterium]|nr:hypothetical protein [Nitrospiraceae bacterium]